MQAFRGYAAYAAWHEQERQSPTPPTEQEAERHRAEDERARQRARDRALARQQARLEQLETTIHQLEARLRELTTALDLAGRAQDIDRVTRLGTEYRQVEAQLNTLLEEWSEVAEVAA